MIALRNLKISTRLALSFGAIAVLVTVLGAISLYRIAQIRGEFDVVMNDRYPKIEQITRVKDALDANARALAELFILSDPAQVAEERASIAGNDQAIGELLARLGTEITSPIGTILLNNVADARAAYKEPRDAMLRALTDGSLEEARMILLRDVRPKLQGYLAALDGLVTYQNELMLDSGNAVTAAVRGTMIVVPVLAGLVVLLGVALSLSIVRATTRPINQAVQVARAVAQGDLAVSVQTGGTNETGLLLAALNEMRGRLAGIVTDVRRSSQSVATASAQIAQGNDDMSGRTERQASALEETAAAMEQLQSAVRQNAASAGKANDMAMNASAIATRGGVVVEQVVSTMQDINESSRRIADIIGVIDGIAFQTNILALNAAVEAARAGEQGRGFAVVAAEVRSLAQRCTEAAREIKALIGASVERVQSGTDLADQAGTTMAEIVASVKGVSAIIGDISRSSSEQSAGVDQVGQAITQMDEVTQQNAALVEQSAAAAASLRAQADQLVAAVAVFRVAATPA